MPKRSMLYASIAGVYIRLQLNSVLAVSARLMSQEPKGIMDEPKPAFAAMFDIVGFKALRKRLGTRAIFQKFDQAIMPAIQHSAALGSKIEERDGVKVVMPSVNEFSVSYLSVSDTILFWTRDASYHSFSNILYATRQLFSFCWAHEIALRGAVAYGDLIAVPEKLIVGTAIEEAYEFEAAQAWAGALLTPDCTEFARANGFIQMFRSFADLNARLSPNDGMRNWWLNVADTLVEYRAPIQRNPKNGPVQYDEIDAVVLNWPINTYRGAADKALPVVEASDHSTRIRENTIKFETWSTERTYNS